MQRLASWSNLGKTVGPFLGPALGAAVSGWFQRRAGRKLRLQVGDIEVEASNQAEVEQLLELAIEIRKRQTNAGNSHE
ncbi:hypothetical protein [Burkholderia sp. PAMC 26561]|uniref:hypothetical protein n=1 Tax=Burkholderia sp. PAMC 26561 TaxID=1795043 RepID=UPI000AF11578|nr:hypothetical protein [Burkholderia sp. PAMC 26561]